MNENNRKFEQRYVDLLSDAGFKAVFCDENNKQVVMDFLNVVLEGERTVESIEFVRNEMTGLTQISKGIRFDLICRDADGVSFVVEMQKQRHGEDFFLRSTFYGASVFSRQLRAGLNYDLLQPTYVIAIMEDGLEEEKNLGINRLVSRYSLMEEKEKILAPKTIILTFVQLRNFNLRAEECKTAFQMWCYTCKYAAQLPEKPDCFSADGMNGLYSACEIAQFDEVKREQYQHEMMLEIDYLHDMRLSRKEGLEEGRAEGLAEGHASGIRETAAKFKAAGVSVDIIKTATGLSDEEIAAL